MPTPSSSTFSPIESPCHPMVTEQAGYPLRPTHEGAKGLSSQTHCQTPSPLGAEADPASPWGHPATS